MTDNVVAQLALIEPAGPVYDALAIRADVISMTQAAHDAALMPRDPGGLSHSLRAAFAARVARLNEERSLADHYLALLEATDASETERAAADPAFKGDGGDRVSAMIAFADLVSMRPRDAAAGDIEALQAAGISDPDIVRLAELSAFLAYQMRVIAGLKLMKATA